MIISSSGMFKQDVVEAEAPNHETWRRSDVTLKVVLGQVELVWEFEEAPPAGPL